MARPKKIELEHGTVELHGFPREVSELLAAHIKAFEQPTILIPAGKPLVVPTLFDTLIEAPQPAKVEIVADITTLPSRTIGTHIDGNTYHLVTIAYDIKTGQTVIDKVEKADGVRDMSSKFKMAADKYKFV